MEMFPTSQRCLGRFERHLALPETDSRVVDVVACRRHPSRGSNGTVRQPRSGLRIKKGSNYIGVGFAQQEHRDIVPGCFNADSTALAIIPCLDPRFLLGELGHVAASVFNQPAISVSRLQESFDSLCIKLGWWKPRIWCLN